MSDSRIGIELDGARATLVAVVDGAAVFAKAFTGATPGEALTAALAGTKRNDHIRVALVTPGSRVRRLDVTGEMLASRAAFEDAVYTALPVPREGTTAAGLFFDPDALVGATLGAGVGALAPADPVEAAYALLGNRKAEIVPPAFTLTGHDGLHLAVRGATADLTLVVDGRPVAHRQMRCGGLDDVAATLGDGATDVGERRLAAALAGGGVPDPVAAAEVDQYLRKLAHEVRQTRDHWARSGEKAPAEVTVFGTGALATGLDEHLRDAGLTRTELPGLNRSLAVLAPQQRLAAAGAFLAAATAGDGLPAAAYPNPRALALAVAAARRSKTRRQLVAVLAVLLAAVLAAGVPILRGAIDLKSANAERAAAQTRLDARAAQDQELTTVTRLCGMYRSLTAHDPRWSQVLGIVYTSAAEHGAQVANLTATSDGTTISAAVTATYHGDFTGATAWLSSLKDKDKVRDATPTTISGRDGQMSVSFTFTVPVALLTAPRALDSGSCK